MRRIKKYIAHEAYLSIVQTGLSRMSSIFTREPTNSRMLLIPYIIIAGL